MQQRDVIDFLSRPESYGLAAGEKVQRLDTHISIVFLAGDYAYKLKRAIQLPFVDFRTIESRQHFCELELEINRTFSPNLYIETLAVGVEDGFALGGNGEVVDWLVKMHRFDQSNLFDRLCEENKLEEDALLRLVDRVFECYEHAKRDSSFGGLGGMQRAFEGHYLALDACPAHVFEQGQISDLKQRVSETLGMCGELLEGRRYNGFVRHCHGDLHLRNICFFNNAVTLFDAIEFEPDYAVIDILYDLSFLLMDLIHRGRSDFANLVLNRYLALSGDISGLKVLGVFLSSRATIRAHVSAVASKNQKTKRETEFLEKEARCYLQEARQFLKKQSPTLIAIGGLSGCGKSVLAKGLAPHIGHAPGAFVARTDMIRKRVLGVKPWEKLSQDGYSRAATQRTYKQLYQEIEDALQSGNSVIVDGVFAKPGERNKLEKLAAKLGVSFLGFWLSAPLDVLEQRVTHRRNDVSDADVSVVRMQAGYDIGKMDWVKLDASQDIESVLEKSLSILDAGLESCKN
ncbi:AAA family ATPase [Terasakiella sp.]|uniref:bifunctional aminoglycoside phosphotransferase/ATP-binding protein n=1 Tax=Terasakiella sp. TaxID=2034861 RepID=UPI003AA901B0